MHNAKTAQPSTFSNMRRSHDGGDFNSIQNTLGLDHNEPNITMKVSKRQNRRDNAISQSKNDLTCLSSRFGNLADLKITPLNQRKSVTRKIGAGSITRLENETNPLTQAQVQQENKPELIKIDPNLDESMEIAEDEQVHTYGLLTKVMAGTLDRLGGDRNLQLA